MFLNVLGVSLLTFSLAFCHIDPGASLERNQSLGRDKRQAVIFATVFENQSIVVVV